MRTFTARRSPPCSVRIPSRRRKVTASFRSRLMASSSCRSAIWFRQVTRSRGAGRWRPVRSPGWSMPIGAMRRCWWSTCLPGTGDVQLSLHSEVAAGWGDHRFYTAGPVADRCDAGGPPRQRGLDGRRRAGAGRPRLHQMAGVRVLPHPAVARAAQARPDQGPAGEGRQAGRHRGFGGSRSTTTPRGSGRASPRRR